MNAINSWNVICKTKVYINHFTPRIIDLARGNQAGKFQPQ